MQSSATNPEQYLGELPADRHELVSRLRDEILEHIPAGFEEAVNWGMLVYQVPLSVYPKTYNKQPLAYIGLANQKQYVSLYLMGIYGIPELRAQLEADFNRLGFKLRAGKSCIRFKTEAEVPWAILPKYISAVTLDQFIDLIEDMHS